MNFHSNMCTKSYFNQLKKCFGDKFRSPSLGLRHIEKGIYFDQLNRWFCNFPQQNFYLMMYDLWKLNPKKEIMKFWKFLYPNITIIEMNEWDNVSFAKHRLRKPNKLNQNISIPIELKMKLKEFYKPFNERLDQIIGFKTGF